jgi:cytochrome c biogenesis protein CcmG/thiol:disulfide interchange protein DsbE
MIPSTPHAPAAPSPWAPRIAALTVGLAVILVLALFVWGLGRRGTVGQVPVGARQAPDFSVTLFGQPGGPSGTWRLSEQAGRPVVVNFWASWCIPCEDEAPVLEHVTARYRGRVSLIGIDVQDSDQNARAFLARFRVTYPNAPDPGGQISVDYGMSGVPESYFIGRDGRILRKWAGPLDEGRLVAFVEELLR